MADDADNSVPLSWVVLFILLALGLTAAAVLYAGGGEFGLLLPLH